MTSFESRLLHAARHMPNAQGILKHLDFLFEFWRDVLALPEMDQETFTSRVLAAWSRNSVRGVTLDHVCLTAIVCAAAKLDLTIAQVLALRKRIDLINMALLAAVDRGEREIAQ